MLLHMRMPTEKCAPLEHSPLLPPRQRTEDPCKASSASHQSRRLIIRLPGGSCCVPETVADDERATSENGVLNSLAEVPLYH